MKFANVYNLFRDQCQKYGERPIFYVRDADSWRSISWKQFEDDTLSLAAAFKAKGLSHGASVVILAGNVPEWTMLDIATITAGGVGTGIYPTSSAEQCRFIIEHSDAEFVFTDTVEQRDKVLSIRYLVPHVKEVLCINDGTYQDFLEHGSQVKHQHIDDLHEFASQADENETAIMVYTSGTTGDPKGAMLSHEYILKSVESLKLSVPIFEDDVCLSYLPACHVAERISGIYNRLYNGTSAYFVDDLTQLYAYILEVKPTVFASLPRFFEKIHAGILSKYDANQINASVVNDALGGRMRLLTSGGAPLPNEIAQFFLDADLPILQAYGLTENICTAFNTFENIKFGTVGRPMPFCDVKIADDGEILIKSPMMFSGYYKNAEKTAEMFNDDGWLLSGDLGSIDVDGFLSITGRKKEIIVLSSGKNVAPALVENLVKANRVISQCYLHGDRRSYCVALITVNEAESTDLDRPAVIEMVNLAVAAANEKLSSSEQIKRFKILDRDFSVETNEVTPTMKLRRGVIAENYKKEIEDLYEVSL